MNSTQERFTQLTMSLKARESWLVAIESAAYFAVILTALLGNTLFILAVYKTRALRNPQNYYLISLATTDILNAMVCMPITLVVLIKGRWPFGDLACQFQGSMISISSMVSLLTLGIIAINRYVKIVRSAILYQKIFRKRNVLKSITISWISIASFVFGAFFIRKTVFHFHPGKCLCFVKIDFKDHVGIYSAIGYNILVSLSFPPIVFSYYQVFRKVRAHFAQVAQVGNLSHHDESSVTFTEEVKITAMLFTTILAFFLCWTPSFIIDFYEIFVGYYTLPRQVYMMNIFTYVSSSAVNPMIYGLMKREFKEAYKKVLCCRDG